jgi:hypothetical protein
MNLFVYLPEYHVVVCTGKECRHAVLPIYIDSHLSSPHYSYNTEQYKQVVQEVQQVPGLIQDRRELQWFVFPEPSSPAIPELRTVQQDGLKYRTCRYICCNQVKIQDYCKTVYQ